MHRYQPRFHIVYLPPKHSNNNSSRSGAIYNDDGNSTHFRRFIFPETSFTAVTAYQNQRVSTVFFFLFCISKHPINYLHKHFRYLDEKKKHNLI